MRHSAVQSNPFTLLLRRFKPVFGLSVMHRALFLRTLRTTYNQNWLTCAWIWKAVQCPREHVSHLAAVWQRGGEVAIPIEHTFFPQQWIQPQLQRELMFLRLIHIYMAEPLKIWKWIIFFPNKKDTVATKPEQFRGIYLFQWNNSRQHVIISYLNFLILCWWVLFHFKRAIITDV